MVLLPSMFSSFLQPSSSSAKMAQSGPSKPSNRFSVRVFKTTQSNIPPSFPANGKNDLGSYRSSQPPPPPREPQREQQMPGWFLPPSTGYNSYDSRPRATANYAIYPSATDGTFIYEQSSCSKSDIFSISEMDATSMATFSPAMSTDSTVTLPSTNAGDRSTEYNHPKRPETPAARPGYSTRGQSAPQVPAMNRATSNNHPAHAEVPIDDYRGRSSTTPIHFNTPSVRNEVGGHAPAAGTFMGQIPEYAASSMSEMEVQQRDHIAKINAEYNSTSTGSHYSGNSGSSPEPDARRMPPISRNASMLNREPAAFNPGQQPLHPGLRFPSRVEEGALPHPASAHGQMNAGNGLAAFPQSFPLVERIPSQLPPDHQQSQTGNFLGPSYNPGLVQDPRGPPEPLRSSSYQTSPKKPSMQGPAPVSSSTFIDHRQDRAPAPFVEAPRGRRTSFVPEARENPVSSRSQPDYRYDDAGRRGIDNQSPLRETAYAGRPDAPSRNQSSSPRDFPRSALASDARRDPRTPVSRDSEESRPSRGSRRDSYFDNNRPAKDSRSKSLSPNDTSRDEYLSGHLSSSPVQMRDNLAENDAASGRRGHFSSAEYDQGRERPRTRSISFSSATRPTLPVQSTGHTMGSSQQPQSYEMHRSDSRYASDEERYTRTVDPSGMRGADPITRSMTPHDFERRSDTRTSSSQATHYSQVPTSAASAAIPTYDIPSQRQPASGSAPPAPRTMDRVSSVMQPQAGQARAGYVPETASSRPRAPYPENSAYSQPQPQPLPQPHMEPIRRHSDPEQHHSTKDSRGSRPSDQPLPSLKPSVQHGGRAGNFMGAGTASSEPHRRNSDGDQNPPLRPPLSGRMSAPLLRSVRWNDNLICPSPIPLSARRKGWFNRRGDQLWTNDGAYKAAPAGQEYPPDLDEYPEYEEGWMNEECVRIDLNHRLVPKPPLRSALKSAARN